MGGHPVPEIHCAICNNPVDLRVDLSADEHGKAVHENCYVQWIAYPATLVARSGQVA